MQMNALQVNITVMKNQRPAETCQEASLVTVGRASDEMGTNV